MSETIKGAKELVRTYMKHQIPSLLVGPPGVGKSQLYRELAHDLGIGFIDVRLAQKEPVDLRGLPKLGETHTTWLLPDEWPMPERDGKRGIILFDEITDCNKAMQSAAYQIILDGAIGQHKLPRGWYRAGAGNRRADKAGAQVMSTALARRFAWIEIEADVECFREYCYDREIHHYIPGFLKFRPNLIHSMEGADTKAYPNPASWERVGKMDDEGEAICTAPADIRFRLIRGLVGEGAAGEFETYLRGIDLPDIEEIEASPTRCRIPSEPSHKWALACMIAAYATRQNFTAICQYIKRAEFGRDFEICTVLDATKRDATLCETKAFVEFGTRNQDIRL